MEGGEGERQKTSSFVRRIMEEISMSDAKINKEGNDTLGNLKETMRIELLRKAMERKLNKESGEK